MAYFQEAKPSREPFIASPVVVLGLIAVILVAHVVRLLVPDAVSEQMLQIGALIPARYVPEVWAAQGGGPVSIWDGAFPFVAYLFLHANWLHVGSNCVWLLVAGTLPARRLGALRFLALFFVTGIIAGATLVAMKWGTFAIAAGASGAVAGMMGAAVRIYYGEQMAMQAAIQGGTVHHLVKPLAPLFSQPILIFTVLWCVANAIGAFTGIGADEGMQIAWEAHLGGYFAGLLLIGPFDQMRRRRA